MEPKDPSRETNSGDSLQPNSSADEFFSKMKRDFRRPKPSDEAVAAALQAIQALAGDAALEENAEKLSELALPASKPSGSECPKCGGSNADSNRFCGFCGMTLDRPAAAKSALTAEQHVHHHHYHHHYFPGSGPLSSEEVEPNRSTHPATSSVETSARMASEPVLQMLVEAWTLACNAKRADELSALYSADALLVRPGVPLLRGRKSIRQLLQSELAAGLAEVHLACSEIAEIGELACISGVSRMLVPISPANRQERTGKFLLLARREGTEWKILADAWCLDSPQDSRQTSRINR